MNNVVIPIYKTKLDKYEKLSLIQCLITFKNNNIIIVAPKCLEIGGYTEIFHQYNRLLTVEYFDPQYFEGIRGYNRLMLSPLFYERFLTSDYILIYQLDAYVFKDELDYWASLAYDYIGAPCCFSGSFEWEKAITGNGGLSLRSPSKFLCILYKSGSILSFKSLKMIYAKSVLWKKWLLVLLGVFGYKNNAKYFSNSFDMNEDFFWSLLGLGNSADFKTPPKEISLKFCFEQSPSQLFKKNNGELPFGTHAFMKNEHEAFWRKWMI